MTALSGPRGPGRAAFAALVASVALAAGAVGCGGSDDAAGGDGSSELRVSIAAEPANFNVVEADERPAKQVLMFNVVDPLVRVDFRTGKVEPWLAKSWKQVSPTRLRMKLRDGVKFSDGTPLTADAVVQMVDFALGDEGFEMPTTWFGDVEGAKAVDRQTVDIIHKPSTRILRQLNHLPIYGPASLKAPDSIDAKGPIGTGAFKIAKISPAQSVRLTRNPNYWGEAPATFESMEFTYNADGGVRASALEAGEVDVALSLPLESVEQVPDVVWADYGEHFLLRFQGDGPSVFSDESARIAATQALNREALEGLYQGHAGAFKDNYPFTEQAWGYQEGKPLCDHWGPAGENVDDAKRRVQQGGFGDRPITIAALRGRSPKDGEVAQLLIEQLNAVGFDAKVELLDYEPALDVLVNKPDKYDALLWNDGIETFDGWEFIVSIFLGEDYGDAPKDLVLSDPSSSTYADAQVINTSTDEQKQLDAMHDIMTKACEQAAFVVPIGFESPHGVADGVEFDPPAQYLLTPFDAFERAS